MRLKKSFGLLMVLLALPLAFAGIAQSNAVATLSLSPATGGVYASGSGWTPNGIVTFYFDSEDTDHMFATVKASAGGSFNFVFIPIGTDIALAPHTIKARQGANLATATYSPSSVTPPDDRLLNPILAINNYLQNNIADSLSTIDGKLDQIEEKLDNSKATQILYYDTGYLLTEEPTAGGWLRRTNIEADQPVLFTVSVDVAGLVGENDVSLYSHGGYSPWPGLFLMKLTAVDGEHQMRTITFPETDMDMSFWCADGPLEVRYRIMVQGAPGTVVTVLG